LQPPVRQEWALKIKKEWTLEGQIESLALLKSDTRCDVLLVGLLSEADSPGHAQFLMITGDTIERHSLAEGCDYTPSPAVRSASPTALSSSSSSSSLSDKKHQPHLHRKTEVIASLKHENKAGLFAVSSFHGDLSLKQLGESRNVGLWVRCFEDLPVLTTVKADVMHNGSESLVVCSWNGATHIVDIAGQTVRFPFGQSVRAFTAGTYSPMPGKASTCFVYATFYEEIVVYYDVSLPSTLLPALRDTLDQELDEACEILALPGVKAEREREKAELLRMVLQCPFSTTEMYERYRSKLQSQADTLRKMKKKKSEPSTP
jgi:hypothetical protein